MVTSIGDVFVTDSAALAVYRLKSGSDALERFLRDMRVRPPNGIALSSDETKLFVAGFPDGITVVDLTSGSFRAIDRPADLCLATIDGLYFYRNSLIAVQNGMMTPRVAQLHLAPDLNAIERFEVLERRNPLFNVITTGTIVDEAFYYMANTQLAAFSNGKIEADSKLEPIIVLSIPLSRER